MPQPLPPHPRLNSHHKTLRGQTWGSQSWLPPPFRRRLVRNQAALTEVLVSRSMMKFAIRMARRQGRGQLARSHSPWHVAGLGAGPCGVGPAHARLSETNCPRSRSCEPDIESKGKLNRAAHRLESRLVGVAAPRFYNGEEPTSRWAHWRPHGRSTHRVSSKQERSIHWRAGGLGCQKV